MATSFTDALSEARRRAVLTGMPLTNQEIAGLTNGWFNAQAQLANSRRANQLAQDQLAESRRAAQAQLEAADKAANMQLAGNIGGTVISTLGADYLKNPDQSLLAKGYDTASGYLGDAVGWAGEKLGMGAAPDMGATAAQMSTDSLGNAGVNAQTQGGSLLSRGYDAAADYLGDAVGWAGEKLGMGAAPDLGATAAGTMEAGAGVAGQTGANAATNAGANTAGQGIGAGFSAYLGPAMAGYAAPGLVDAIHKDSNENLGHNLTLGLVQDEGTAKAVGSTATGAAAGALAGAAYGSVGGPVGAGIGAIIGGAAGLLSDLTSDTWICTATAKYSGMKPEEEEAMLKLKKYASEKHRGWWNFYFKHGNGLVYAVMQSEGDMPAFYANIRKVLVEPVCRVIGEDIEAAFQIYMFVTRTLFMAYMPQLEIKEEEL